MAEDVRIVEQLVLEKAQLRNVVSQLTALLAALVGEKGGSVEITQALLAEADGVSVNIKMLRSRKTVKVSISREDNDGDN